MTYLSHDGSPPVVVIRRSRKLGWTALGIVLFVVGTSAFFAWQLPTTVARAFGKATEVTATVDGVEYRYVGGKRASQTWIVSVHWTDPDSPSAASRTGTARESQDPNLHAGDRVSAFVLDDTDDVSLMLGNADLLGFWIALVLLVLLICAAVAMLDRARRWKRLSSVPGERDPYRVKIRTVTVPLMRPLVIEYQPVYGNQSAGSFALYRQPSIKGQPSIKPPAVDEEVEIWSLHPDGGGPLAIRQRNGTWWNGSGSLQ